MKTNETKIKALAVCISEKILTHQHIREIHANNSELLRLIVRDNVEGAGHAVVNAFWRDVFSNGN